MFHPSRRAAVTALIGAVVTLLIGTTPAFGAAAAQLFVDDDGRHGPGCNGTNGTAFKTIQSAVAAVTLDNTRINICPGTYTGRIVIDDENGLIIRAVDPWTATLKPPRSELGNVNLITVSGVRDTKIVWLNIVVPTGDICRGADAIFMVENSPRTQIRANHVRVTDPSSWPCGYDSGVSMYRSPGSVIAWNRFIDFQDRGIWVYQSNHMRIRGNTFFYGHDGFTLNFDYACGICILDASHIFVRGNVIESGPSAGTTAPTMEFGIYADGDHLTVLRNRIRKTIYGAELHVSDSEIEGNTIRRSSGVGFTMGSYLGNQVRDNDFRSGGTLDCLDHSSGSGTAGTGNLWLRNLGRLADPDGICGSP